MIAEIVKQGRIAKGYTQKELSDLSNISVRSIQRIENAEIIPRNYTLRVLAETLGISFETFQGIEESSEKEAYPVYKANKANKIQKLILSVGISLVILLFSWAFLAQSPRFPETDFEFLNFTAVVIVVITVILTIIWRRKS